MLHRTFAMIRAPMNENVFISYARRDRDRVVEVVSHLESAGISVWRDEKGIVGGRDYGPEIVQAIRDCHTLVLCCSAASMDSRNVRQEIKIAWSHARPYLPLLLDETVRNRYPLQIQYWLEGTQWIEVHDLPAEQWLPLVVRALEGPGEAMVESDPKPDLAALRKTAAFTHRIWPVPADSMRRGASPALRGLGAPQPCVKHAHPLGSRIRLVIELDEGGELLLLDEGPEGSIYCLCPSLFAPVTKVSRGRTVLPHPDSPYDWFLLTGVSGREHLLAIVSHEPLGLDWGSRGPDRPARILDPSDVSRLLTVLRQLEPGAWTCLSTYFEITD